MMIQHAHGNLLGADVDALVNTVNTVGVMGKGIALQFKRAYAANFKAYEAACKRGEVRLGEMFVFDAGQLVRPRWVVNFLTKGHWRAKSRLADVSSGLDALRCTLNELEISSIAIPPLGCGNGGLEWADVLPLIVHKLGDLDVDVRVYPPEATPAAKAMPNRSARPKLTTGKAALVHAIARYEGAAVGATLVEAQKLMYFLQEAGEPLRLNYAKARYGPYADNLRHVLASMESHYLNGYGDGSMKVWEAEPIEVLPGADDEAVDVLASRPDTRARVDRVLELVDGFESAYGLELLASVHWITRQRSASLSDEQIRAELAPWSDRKNELFTADHVTTATDRLRAMDWIEQGTATASSTDG